jgi:N-formylglutamate amidohydrolase
MGSASFSTLSEAFNLYADFHAEVTKKIVENNGHTMLIDCHSFSSIPNMLNRNPPSDIDICIGYNDDDTCPDKVVISNIVQHFKSQGYKVGINEPFSNSKTFAVPVKYHSVMIEINKRLYMNEETLEKSGNFACLHQIIESLYRKLLKNN